MALLGLLPVKGLAYETLVSSQDVPNLGVKREPGFCM